MKVLQTYKDGLKQEISLERCVDIAEGGGFYKKDTVKTLLESGQKVITFESIFSLVD